MNVLITQRTVFYSLILPLLAMAELPPDSPFGPNAKYDQFDKIPSLTTAHGTLMGLTFVVLLPLGSLLIRLVKSKYGIWIHVACQLIGWVMMLAGLAMGIQLADIVDIVSWSLYILLTASKL